MEEIKEQNKPENKQFECIICYELAKLPVKTECCKQVTCLSHSFGFKNKCPMCRKSPLNLKNDENMHQQILTYRAQDTIEKNKQKQNLQCNIQGCQFTGNYDELSTHLQEKHDLQVDIEYVKKILLKKDNKDFQEAKQKHKQENDERPPPSYGTRKNASREQVQQMQQHVSECQNEKCRHLWRGPWGPFIGGEMGRTHFDLTECEAGKLLNENILWNYDDPAF